MGAMNKVDQLINEWKLKGGDFAKCGEDLEEIIERKNEKLELLADKFYQDLSATLKMSKEISDLKSVYSQFLVTKKISM